LFRQNKSNIFKVPYINVLLTILLSLKGLTNHILTLNVIGVNYHYWRCNYGLLF